MSLDELKAEAMKLSPEARAQLAHYLLLSLDDLSETEIEGLWLEEALRRDDEIDAGKVTLRTAEEVFSAARSRFP
jgi:putative addiction module component (TIGR02574 family)